MTFREGRRRLSCVWVRATNQSESSGSNYPEPSSWPLVLASWPVFGQQAIVDSVQVQAVANRRAGEAETPSKQTKFDLDFPGGTPDELVSAIQKALGRPLNAVVPTEFAAERIPPVKVTGVDAQHLFEGLLSASMMNRRSVNPDTG